MYVAETLSHLEKSELNIQVIQDFDAFLTVEKAWDRLIRDEFDGHPFFRHFWFANYYRAFFSSVPLYVLTAHDSDGTVIGAMPMVLWRRRLAGVPLKEARLLAGDHSHVNRVLVPSGREEVLREFLEWLFGEGVDVVYLEDLPEAFPDADWIREFCSRRRLALDVRSVRRSPFIPTTGSFTDYRKTLSKKFRELLNNRLNRINREGGFEIITFSEVSSYERMIGDVAAIAGGSWQGAEGSGLFSGASNDLFYRSLLRHALENRYGRVYILYFEGRPAAFEFHVSHGTTEYCLKSEYVQAFEKVSPGGVLDLELVKRAFASDIEVYDLLGFEDQYKLRWTGRLTPYYRYLVFNRSVAARTAHLLYYRLGNRLRRMKFLRRLKESLAKQ